MSTTEPEPIFITLDLTKATKFHYRQKTNPARKCISNVSAQVVFNEPCQRKKEGDVEKTKQEKHVLNTFRCLPVEFQNSKTILSTLISASPDDFDISILKIILEYCMVTFALTLSHIKYSDVPTKKKSHLFQMQKSYYDFINSHPVQMKSYDMIFSVPTCQDNNSQFIIDENDYIQITFSISTSDIEPIMTPVWINMWIPTLEC